MTRKIITLAAAALAIGTLALAPRAVEAQSIGVSAAVSTASAISGSTNANTVTWTGAAIQAVPFTITVVSNDTAGYQFTFTGAGAPAFSLHGTAIPANAVAYTVTAVGGAAETYTSGTLNATVYPGPTPGPGTTSTFDVNLPIAANVTSDTYVDTITAIVTPS